MAAMVPAILSVRFAVARPPTSAVGRSGRRIDAILKPGERRERLDGRGGHVLTANRTVEQRVL